MDFFTVLMNKLTLLARVFYSGLFYCSLIVLTLVGVASFGPLYLWGMRRYGNKAGAVRWCIWIYGWACLRILRLFTPVTVHGLPSPVSRPCVVVANHRSFFDAYTMAFMPEAQVVFPIRNWPFSIPVYGWFMRKAGYINIETNDGAEFLEQSTHLISQGVSIAVFPEGTRSRKEGMGRFHSGAFQLAMAVGVPVLPLCIKGMGDFWPADSFLLKRSPISIHILPPVHPELFASAGEGAHRELRRTVKKNMRDVLESEKLPPFSQQ